MTGLVPAQSRLLLGPRRKLSLHCLHEYFGVSRYADTSADLAIENGLLSFFCFFAARFSISVFAGFFFVSFFLSMPLLMYVSWISSGE
jgi:hypothetical protein